MFSIKIILASASVLVCSGGYNSTIDWVDEATFISHSSGSWDSCASQFRSWWQPTSWFAEWPPSCCVLTWWRETTFLMSLLLRALILFMRIPSSWLNYLPKDPLPNIFTLGIKFRNVNFGGNSIHLRQPPSRDEGQGVFWEKIIWSRNVNSRDSWIFSMNIIWFQLMSLSMVHLQLEFKRTSKSMLYFYPDGTY